MDSSGTGTATGNQGNSSSKTNNVLASKPSQKPAEVPSQPTGGSSSKPNNPGNNGGGSASKPSNPGNNGMSSSSKPAEKPATHTHNWKKWPKGMTTDWSADYSGSPPDENGYTNNKEIAEDKNGKKIGIYMCASCYMYFGRPDNDEWIGRFWDHVENGHGRYCSYPVYAVFDVYYCEGCGHFKRGAFSFYGYYDYSKEIPEWIYLEPWQIEELNLKKL